MRLGGAYIAGLLLVVSGGCKLLEPERSPPAPPDAAGTFALPKDYVQMDVALLERPIGEAYLSNDLWTNTDQTVVRLDCRAAVDDNGFRVGQIVGLPPEGLQALLRSRRSCLNPRRWLLPTGAAARTQQPEPPRLLLGPPQAEGQFILKQQGRTTEVNLDNVEYELEVEPGLTSDGRISLRFTPRVQHGDVKRSIVVPPDRTDYVVR